MADPKPNPTNPKVVALRPDEAPAESAEAESRGPRRLLWLLGIALLIALLLAGWQAQKLTQLEGRVAELSLELAGARASLGAYQRHRGAVQSSFGELSSTLATLEERMGALGELVESDPLAPRSRALQRP